MRKRRRTRGELKQSEREHYAGLATIKPNPTAYELFKKAAYADAYKKSNTKEGESDGEQNNSD